MPFPMSARAWRATAFHLERRVSSARNSVSGPENGWQQQGVGKPYRRVTRILIRGREKFGGRDRVRTCDLMLAKHALSQLSYTPTVLSILKHFFQLQNHSLGFCDDEVNPCYATIMLCSLQSSSLLCAFCALRGLGIKELQSGPDLLQIVLT